MAPATVPADPLQVPRRSRYQERRDDRTIAHESEWLYHLLALDIDAAFPIALDRVTEAFGFGDDREAPPLFALESDLELRAGQRHLLRLIGEAVEARLRQQFEPAARSITDALTLIPRDTAARAIMLLELGVILVNADRHAVALRHLNEAYETAIRLGPGDPRWVRVACLARGIQGLVLLERDGDKGEAELDESLAIARQAGDVRLLAEAHRIRVRALASLGLSRSEGAAREALLEIDSSVATDVAAAITCQLTHALCFRDKPDYVEADRLLQKSLSSYHAVDDTDGQVEVLCRQATLALLMGDRIAASQKRTQALALSTAAATTHANLGNLASWANLDKRAILEFRCACAADLLSRMVVDANSPAGSADRPDAAALQALLRCYGTEMDAVDGRVLGASTGGMVVDRARDERDHPSLDAGGAVEVPGWPARRDLESVLLRFEGEPSFRYGLAELLTADAAAAREPNKDADENLDNVKSTWTEVVEILQSIGAASSDDATMVLRLAAARDGAGDNAEATSIREGLVDTLTARLRDTAQDPDLYAALGEVYSILNRKEDASQAYQSAYDLDPTTRRLLSLTKSLSANNQWQRGSRLVEQVLKERQSPEPALLDEAARLLYPVGDAEEQARAEALALAFPSVARLSLIAGMGLAATIRERAKVRRSRNTSEHAGLAWSSATDPGVELTVEVLDSAISYFRAAAAASDDDLGPLLDAAELLLDIADVAPEGAPTAWSVLEPVASDLLTRSADDRVRICLARAQKCSTPTSGQDAAATLELMRCGDIARRVADLRPLKPDLSVDAPSALILEVGRELVEWVDPSKTPSAERLYTEMIVAVRNSIKSWFGFELPGVTVQALTDGPDYSASLVVRGSPPRSFRIRRGFCHHA